MNIIQQTALSSFKTNTITLANEIGSGNMEAAAPSGACVLMYGQRKPVQSKTTSYNMSYHESCSTWMNIGTVQYNLPTAAPTGYAALFIRTSGVVTVNPGPSARIWNPGSGLYRPTGQAAFLASSGARLALVSNGQNGWFPLMENGTIS